MFVETETDWLGRVIQKMDKRLGMGDDWMSFAKFLGREKGFTKLASEYWAQNCYAGLSPFNATSECSVDEIIGEAGTTNPDGSFALGAERCMFGVDYPHFETLYPDVPQAVAGFVRDPRVTESHARQVLYQNVAKVFGSTSTRYGPTSSASGFTTEDVLGASTSLMALSADEVADRMRAAGDDPARSQQTLASLFAEQVELRHVPPSSSDGPIPGALLAEVSGARSRRPDGPWSDRSRTSPRSPWRVTPSVCATGSPARSPTAAPSSSGRTHCSR